MEAIEVLLKKRFFAFLLNILIILFLADLLINKFLESYNFGFEIGFKGNFYYFLLVIYFVCAIAFMFLFEILKKIIFKVKINIKKNINKIFTFQSIVLLIAIFLIFPINEKILHISYSYLHSKYDKKRSELPYYLSSGILLYPKYEWDYHTIKILNLKNTEHDKKINKHFNFNFLANVTIVENADSTFTVVYSIINKVLESLVYEVNNLKSKYNLLKKLDINGSDMIVYFNEKYNYYNIYNKKNKKSYYYYPKTDTFYSSVYDVLIKNINYVLLRDMKNKNLSYLYKIKKKNKKLIRDIYVKSCFLFPLESFSDNFIQLSKDTFYNALLIHQDNNYVVILSTLKNKEDSLNICVYDKYGKKFFEINQKYITFNNETIKRYLNYYLKTTTTLPNNYPFIGKVDSLYFYLKYDLRCGHKDDNCGVIFYNISNFIGNESSKI